MSGQVVRRDLTSDRLWLWSVVDNLRKGAATNAVKFDTPVGECLRRNELRDGRARVPVTGIVGTARRIEAPRPDEGFDALYRVHPDGCGGFAGADWGEDVGRP